jgi:hypothetical protein
VRTFRREVAGTQTAKSTRAGEAADARSTLILREPAARSIATGILRCVARAFVRAAPRLFAGRTPRAGAAFGTA